MIPIPQQFLEVFQWLVRCSFHGTVLLAIILLVRAAIKGTFRFRMVYWLWMLLLLRLIWPLDVQTTFSVFNLIPQGATPEQYLSAPTAEESATPVALSGDALVTPPPSSADPVSANPTDVSASGQNHAAPVRTVPVSVAVKQPFDWRQSLCAVWLVGAAVMVGYVLLSNFRLWRIVKRQRLVTRQDILDLLEDCKAQLQLQTVVGVVETDKVKTPCLFGYLRPRLLLPAGTLEQLTPEQIRYVFLHELAHLKRHDILIGWLMAAVQVLHWFNPAVWYAMAQISADRELACDELTLSTLTENEPQAYGSTILTFLEKFSKKQHVPGMAGIAENQFQLRRRMTMIATFKNRKASAIPALVVMLVLVATTLTNAKDTSSIEDIKVKADVFVDLLVNEQFEEATQNFDNTMNEALPHRRLAEVWKATTGQAGSFEKKLGIRAERLLWRNIVYVTCQFENGPMDVKVVYDKNMQISGLWFVPVSQSVLEEYAPKAEALTPENIIGTWQGTAIDKPVDGTSKRGLQLQFIAQNKQLTGSATGNFVKDNYCELRNLEIDDRTLYFEIDSRIENLQMKVFLNLKDGKLQGEGIPMNGTEDRCDIVLVKMQSPTTSAASSDEEAPRLLQAAASGRGPVSVIQTPSSENDFSMIVRFDDNSYSAAGWYDVTLKIAAAPKAFDIRIKAYIDGISDLVLKGNTAYWHNQKWAVPGRHGESNYPTTINGVQWYPNWPGEQSNPDEPRGLQKSDMLSGLPFTLPSEEVDVQFEKSGQMEAKSSEGLPQWVSVEGEQGPSGYALKFDGASNFVRVPKNRSLEPKTEMTIEMWAYIDGPQSLQTRLMRKADHMGAGYLLATDQGRDGRMQIRFDDGRRTIRAADPAKHSKYVGAWHHFSGVYAKDTVAFYVDGKLTDKQSHPVKDLMHSPVDLYIGHGAPGGPTEYFKGMIDEVRIWNVARTEQQIKDNMRSSVPSDATGLAAYWKFDKGEGNIAHDSTSNQNHGRLESSGAKMPGTMKPVTGGKVAMPGPVQSSSSNLQAMIDAAGPGKTVMVPAGTYDKPIKITKALSLKGIDREKCVFKVTANEPAIIIDTKGKGVVGLQNVTIRWQLATSDKHEMPFALAIKDTKAKIGNCVFRPLGNPQRSPVAIRSIGFSEMDVVDCDFTGFDYVVCYGEGTKGKMQDCFIRNCGHQGVILYSGAEATVQRNIITGSRYHAVRTTGGMLDMKDNLIINNKNRGVYLGNKSGSGQIVNNLIIGNGSGIDGMSACRFVVANNVILKSTYSAISARPYTSLLIRNNVLVDNVRGMIVHQEEGKSDPVKSQLTRNIFWNNQTDTENIEGGDVVNLEPDFIEPDNGNFKLADPDFKGMGLKDPKVIFDLWQKYKENE